MELSSHVGRVTKDAGDKSPFDLEKLNEEAGDKHAREDQTDVDSSHRPGTKIINFVDGRL